ncbi:hypothetical protein EHP00_1212 [Ecytonucleospora hepatopenaei]|uniref:Uncharacterized protein n=1 Tax=Ecytonucleospora hepatopenaei TaxID=646526 RepID=A0A1W0E835_9MICR|nr:hypothetical protein EHP00_1212 [Ecytonucleospora hepatopenaei]
MENTDPSHKNINKNHHEVVEFQELRTMAEKSVNFFLMKDLTLWHVFFYKVKKGEEHWYVTQVQLVYSLERLLKQPYINIGFEKVLRYFFTEGQMYIYFSIGTIKSEKALLECKENILLNLRKYFEFLIKHGIDGEVKHFVKELKTKNKIDFRGSFTNNIYIELCQRDEKRYEKFIENLSKVNIKLTNTCLFFETIPYYSLKMEYK